MACLLTCLSVGVYGGGYHLWEVTAEARVHYMKVSFAHLGLGRLSSDNTATGNVRRNNIVRPHDLVHQA